VTIDTPTTYIYDRRGEGVANLLQWLIVAVAAVAAIFVFGLGRKGPEPSLQPAVFDIVQLASHSQEIEEGFSVAPIAHARTGEVSFAHLEDVSFPMHYHGQSEIAYVLQGEFTLEFADESYRTVGPGELVVIPAGVATSVSGSGDIVLFSAPPENERDTVWLEGPRAKRGAKADPTRKPDIISVTDRITGGLDRERAGFRFTVAFESPTGSVELFRIEQGVALHKHPKENHVLYILKGHGKGQIGDQTAEVGPGQIVVIPANVPHKLERIGDEPLDFILFSTPGFHPDDIVWLETPQQTSAPREIVIKATDFSFEAPEKIEGGLVTVTMENEGAELHHLQLARLRDGVTFDQVHKVLAEGPEDALFELLEWVGGPSLVSPGGQSRVVLTIPEGQYLLLCFVASPDGVPHFAKGMAVPIIVTASSTHAAEPQADLSVVLTDFAFTMPAQIKAGHQVWKVTNRGAQPHEIVIARLMPGKTLQDALRFLQAPEGAPPFEFMGGLQAIDSERTGWAVLDLPAGNYLALCFVPDPASGKAHIELGMVAGFTVK
jgi:mannose-6-phosphate isomerase-like protein (cupin superfamily)